MHQLTLDLRRQELIQDEDGHNTWHTVSTVQSVAADRTAIIVCDMWDKHWSRGASERVVAMVTRMNNVLVDARKQGVHIIHAPSDTLDFYADAPARQRIVAIPPVEPPTLAEHDNPPLPIDDSDGGSDTNEPGFSYPWTRQHPALEIDQARDLISDNGAEIYSYLHQQSIEQVLLMGVHTNMCILNRSFGIKQMVRWGVQIALVRDLTDAMYNPAKAPYVSHDAGTQLVIEYIEKFWCPSLVSQDILS